VYGLVAETDPNDTILVASHGAVGALLMADLLGAPISRDFDQPGDSGGNWFAFNGASWSLIHQWLIMDP
jgi:broad specificity phosphatase PhoE